MNKNNILELSSPATGFDPLTQLLRSGAQKLIQQAVEAELQVLLEEHADRRTDDGRAGVVRNGYLPERDFQTTLGPCAVNIPKVRSKTGEPVTFRSALVPPYVRKSQSLEAAIPWLYLKGISSGEMSEALSVLVGPQAKGMSPSTVSRLKQAWGEEYKQWCKKPLDKDEWVYIWADGIHSGLRDNENKLCALVVIGVNKQGEKHFLAIEDGSRESTQSWREVLLNLESRGMNSPKLAIGDGALGFWAAMDEVYPKVRHQRCWVHKTANILNCLPKSSQPKAKSALHEIWQAETRVNADKAFDLFVKTYEAKYPKATVCLQKDHEELMSFFDFPAQHWKSIRTSNPIESAFATIRHRTKRTKGCLNRDGMLHMMFKLGECAEKKWIKLKGFKLLAKVITGVNFKDGIEVITPSETGENTETIEVDQVAA